EDAHPAARVPVEFVPFIGDLKMGWQVFGGGMRAIFDEDGASLIGRMGGVRDTAQKVLKPLPIRRAGRQELSPRKSGAMDPHPSLAALYESLQCLLLRVRHVEGG